MNYLIRLWNWFRSLFVDAPFYSDDGTTTTKLEDKIVWIAVQGAYEKWTHHAARHNLKHYRAIFRNNRGERRISRVRHRTATLALAYADHFNACIMRKVKR